MDLRQTEARDRSAEGWLCARKLNERSQNELGERTGIAQSTPAAIETDRVKLGTERAKMLARALNVHPAALLFPGWRTEDESAA